MNHRPKGLSRNTCVMSPSGTPDCPTPLYCLLRKRGLYLKVVVVSARENKQSKQSKKQKFIKKAPIEKPITIITNNKTRCRTW